MMESIFKKSIELFLIIDTYSIGILLSILSFALLSPEKDKDLIEIDKYKSKNMEDYIQEIIHSKRLENISEKELKNLIKISKMDKFGKKHKKEIQDLKESISYFHEKKILKGELLRISFLKKSGFIIITLLIFLIKIYMHSNLQSVNINLYSWNQKLYIILLYISFYIAIIFTLYIIYKSIRFKIKH